MQKCKVRKPVQGQPLSEGVPSGGLRLPYMKLYYWAAQLFSHSRMRNTYKKLQFD